MASYLNVQNKLVTCPYDEAHKVKESRLQLHIAKCRLNHLEKQMEQCPFNATHVFNQSEKSYHVLNCPDRTALDRAMTQSSLDQNNPYKGRTAVPSYTESNPIITDENWDDEISYQPRPGYMPQAEPPPGAIVEPPPMSRPAERRKLYKDLHKMQSEPNKIKEIPENALPATPRQPKQPSETSILQSLQKKQSPDLQNLGLGRGKLNMGSRIAANIFPANIDTENKNDVPSYSAITNGMSRLGLGRGQPVNRVENFNEDDFPALGLGRGAHRAPKNNVGKGSLRPRSPN